MDEKQMAATCLILAILGIASLYFLAETMQPKQARLSKITTENVGEYVEVFGIVRSASNTNGNAFIKTCEGQACISVIVFKKTAEKMQNPSAYLLEKNDRITARGTIEEYKGELELVVNKADGIKRV
ncbi:OB-fold nucleic acid binding domain-containing protein [Candidatus Micrarchaeota archaeon]|nr:OB-fold nucleic acid binding domain-containing protein [Candidatus Micrarchaeota archaeon]